MKNEIYSLLKQTEKHSHPVAGPSVENLYTTFSVSEIGGKKFLNRQTRNDYVIVHSCQYGVTDSQKIAASLGLAL